MEQFLEMLAYKRPEGSIGQAEFCNRFLEPVFSQPDSFGNYILSVGDKPNIVFTSHHDTVHKQGGKQSLIVEGDTVSGMGDDCLGADCTTGVFIMLEMIKAQVPGLYIVHAAEEIGCVGSRSMLADTPSVYFDSFDAVISFDRYGTRSIVTHQCGLRTASEAFAASLESILALGMVADDSGVYTDSNEYRFSVSECTNISVGYYHQHTDRECQDMLFLRRLVRALIAADWSKLIFARPLSDPDECAHYFWDTPTSNRTDSNMVAIVEEYPELIAELLEQFGYNASGLLEELNIDPSASWRFN